MVLKGRQLGIRKGEISKDVVKTLKRWLDQGEDVAVYRNVDLSSREVGRLAFMRVGKKSTIKKAPNRMPDSPAIPIAWRYRLETVVKSKKALEKVL